MNYFFKKTIHQVCRAWAVEKNSWMPEKQIVGRKNKKIVGGKNIQIV
jgi:hypothetical protein